LRRVLGCDGGVVRAAPDQAGLDADARRGQGCLYPRSRSAEEVKRSPAGGHVADEGDPLVPQADEVASRQPPAGHVVDDRLRNPGLAASTLTRSTPARANWPSWPRDSGRQMASTPSARCVGS
jgi:hypothetical protein